MSGNEPCNCEQALSYRAALLAIEHVLMGVRSSDGKALTLAAVFRSLQYAERALDEWKG